MNHLLATLLVGITIAANSAEPLFVKQSSINWDSVVAKDGVKRVVLSGDPTSAALFSQRALFPAGYNGAPHTHPVDLHVVVIRGESRLGFSLDTKAEQKVVRAGDYMMIPANTIHYEQFDVETEIHLYGVGPMRTVPASIDIPELR